ncbi:hypothetical protein RM553_04475 [Zunongwangia sp. F363]|uniref:Uncharacterized protein n=1 Tax=Autumnicola tepida TaxID=3075595 RepID=A0ABU3C6W0_9FLAO|nr:hypothetical protein [Zunongwangia sp. F363]MDT0642080.1 hypothetical protein [Zunongwangia sp. F363]
MRNLMLAVLIFSCGLMYAQQEEVELKVYQESLCSGDVFEVNTHGVKFKKVISDSRCPRNVTCIWAGEVKVLLEFFENGKSVGEKIVAGTNFPLEDFFGKSFALSDFAVYPYPESPQEIQNSEYSLQLKITEKVED